MSSIEIIGVPGTRPKDLKLQEVGRVLMGLPQNVVWEILMSLMIHSVHEQFPTRGQALALFDHITAQSRANLASKYGAMGKRSGKPPLIILPS